jgi:F0F1-type ATP synthase membrane subunit b/b'
MEHHQDFAPLLPYAVNFAIVVVILVVALRKPLRKYLYQRHEHMKDAFESATIAHSKALARAEAARKSVSGLAKEEADLSTSERAFAENEKKEILAKSQQEVARVAAEAERLASFESANASEKVKEEFLRLVVSQTEESLRKNLKKDDHSAIVKRAQSSIEVGV